IIQKGFQVSVGTVDEINSGEGSINPEAFRLLSDSAEDSGIRPYLYVGKIGDVDVEIYAGLYRELLNEDELDEEQETRGTSDEAGWTISCNDRVVVWKDKSRLTGWGEANVP